MDQVQAMRVFVRIVEAESFSRAAEKLGLPRATVSQTLKRLELRLGVRLLQRTTRQVQVTDEGMLYYQRCVQLLAEIEETDALFSRQRQQPSGRVRIDMPHSLARQVVIPSLPEFYRRYPQISLVLSANDSAINVMREGVDCVLRAWQVDDDSLVARSLPSLPQVTCASAAYCAEFGVPDTLEALTSTVWWAIFRCAHRIATRWSSCSRGKSLPAPCPVWWKSTAPMPISPPVRPEWGLFRRLATAWCRCCRAANWWRSCRSCRRPICRCM